MRYILILCTVVGTGGCISPEETHNDGRASLPGEVTADPMTESEIGGFDQRVWDYSISAFLLRFPDIPDSCLQAPTVRWVNEFTVCPEDAGGCAYFDDDDRPNVEMLNGAIFYHISTNTCRGRVSGLLHEYMHHHMYCVEGYFGHPDEYYGESLDTLRSEATQDLCDE